MKSQINKIVKIVTFLFIISSSSYAATTFTWIGASNTSWTTPGNWKVGSTVQSSNYPGKSNSTDIAQIGVAAYSGSYQPTISSSVTFASIEFGTHNSPVLTIAALKTLTLGNGLKIDLSSTVSIIMSSTSTLDISNGSINNLGTFSISNGIIQLEAGGPNITNSGTFTVNAGATINAAGNGNTATNIITNSGTFYAGTSNSVCTIQLDDSNSILNQSTGTFYLGSTSIITYYNSNAHDCNITNTSGGYFYFTIRFLWFGHYRCNTTR